MLLFYVRHGDPIYEPDSLTPLGKRQAEAVSRRLALYGIDKIYASSSTRAILTATPTSEITKKEIEILDWANEKYAWMQMSLIAEDGNRRWCFQHNSTKRFLCTEEIRKMGFAWYDHPKFAGTTYKEGVERVKKATDEFMADLGYVHDHENHCYDPVNPNDDRVALFAHQGFGLLFLSCLLDIPYPEITTRFDMSHSNVTVINFKIEDGAVMPKVLTLSNDSHIYRDGLPTKYNNAIYF